MQENTLTIFRLEKSHESKGWLNFAVEARNPPRSCTLPPAVQFYSMSGLSVAIISQGGM